MDFVSNIITDFIDRATTFMSTQKLFNRSIRVDTYSVKCVTNTCYQITDNYITTITVTTNTPIKPGQIVDLINHFYTNQNIDVLFSKFQYTGLKDFKLTVRYRSTQITESLKYWINTNTDYRAV